MPRPSHPSLLDDFNYTWRRVRVVKVLIMQSEECTQERSPDTVKFYIIHFDENRSEC
jgi:hypothetical protein